VYWQPNQAEREAAAKASPQLQFSTNAVSNTALIFVAITPCRLVDTRGAAAGFNGIAPFSGPSISAGATLALPVQSTAEASANTEPAPCGVIPTIAQAYSFNLTVVPHSSGAVDYVTLWPSGSPKPFVATLNDPQGAIVANAAIVAAGTPTGGISVYNYGPATTDVIIDMNGYFTAPTDVNNNTAVGAGTLQNNATGAGNTAVGSQALLNNITGSNNIAVGFQSADGVSGGNSNNIHVGSQGASGDNGVIRIGTPGTQTITSIAGIYGGSPTMPNLPICIDGNGTLGTNNCGNIPFFREQIADMGDRSSKLLELRPVTFFSKPQDAGSRELQYGLIPEEVAKIYPEMVGYDKDGKPASVKYQMLAPMLVNELQKQNAQIQFQQEENRKLEDRLAALEALLAGRTSTAAPAESNR
jgi:hypothetical protein